MFCVTRHSLIITLELFIAGLKIQRYACHQKSYHCKHCHIVTIKIPKVCPFVRIAIIILKFLINCTAIMINTIIMIIISSWRSLPDLGPHACALCLPRDPRKTSIPTNSLQVRESKNVFFYLQGVQGVPK